MKGEVVKCPVCLNTMIVSLAHTFCPSCKYIEQKPEKETQNGSDTNAFDNTVGGGGGTGGWEVIVGTPPRLCFTSGASIDVTVGGGGSGASSSVTGGTGGNGRTA